MRCLRGNSSRAILAVSYERKVRIYEARTSSMFARLESRGKGAGEGGGEEFNFFAIPLTIPVETFPHPFLIIKKGWGEG